ncbi:MAG: iron-containing redox enzyme family protein [Nitrospinae bacterium]|nr:iron-containing redox enzyme family protein [Nitrospinota bacterium]MBL7020121.1 iron-containing redox enzyme family protein [Nitrospinaceae bacterium]
MNFNSQTDSTALDFAYQELEEEFLELLGLDNLDRVISKHPERAENFKSELKVSLSAAFRNETGCPQAHLFLQRILYRINRLKLFWYDGLENYVNEDSAFLFSLRLEIEDAWQDWEESNTVRRSSGTLSAVLRDRVQEDLQPEPSPDGLFIRNEISKSGYQCLLAITSLDGLVEASQLSRMLGGVGNEVQMMLTRILWEEYGSGKFSRKHSTHFATMLEECDMDSRPETYFDLVPWEVLANINHNFYLSERKKNFLRYIGGLLYTEVSVPAAFENIKMAGERLKMGDKGVSYWDLHIREDIRHGQWMLDDVTLPLIEKYPEQGWDMVKGYDQQKFISFRSTAAIVETIRRFEFF